MTAGFADRDNRIPGSPEVRSGAALGSLRTSLGLRSWRVPGGFGHTGTSREGASALDREVVREDGLEGLRRKPIGSLGRPRAISGVLFRLATGSAPRPASPGSKLWARSR